MGYEDEIIAYLKTFSIGDVLTTRQIKEGVNNMFGTNEGSVIPSDYCYNIINLDPKAYDFLNGHPRLLEQIKRGYYRYLGLNYQYNGEITHKGIVVGYWKNGKFTKIL